MSSLADVQNFGFELSALSFLLFNDLRPRIPQGDGAVEDRGLWSGNLRVDTEVSQPLKLAVAAGGQGGQGRLELAAI